MVLSRREFIRLAGVTAGGYLRRTASRRAGQVAEHLADPVALVHGAAQEVVRPGLQVAVVGAATATATATGTVSVPVRVRRAGARVLRVSRTRRPTPTRTSSCWPAAGTST